MRPGAIAACIIALIVVIKDPHLVSELINGIVSIFNSGPRNG